MSDSSESQMNTESSTQVMPFNARRFVADNFTGDDRVWAEMGLLMMQTVGVSREQQQAHFTKAAALCDETGESCETLFGDPLDWATEIGNLDDSVDVPQKSALRRPRRASWKGRFFYASGVMIFWAIMATMHLYAFSPSDSGITGNLHLVVGAVLLFAVPWLTLLWNYEGMKYISDSLHFLTYIASIAAAIFVVIGVKEMWPTVTLWDGVIPYWVPLVALLPGIAGLRFFRGSRSIPWPEGPVSNRRWRSTFLGVMTGQKIYPARWAKKYLRELEADAAEIAAQQGRSLDLNVLGPAHLVAASFPTAEPERDPVLKRYELRQSIFTWVIIAGILAPFTVVHFVQGDPLFVKVSGVLGSFAPLGLAYMRWLDMRAVGVKDNKASDGKQVTS